MVVKRRCNLLNPLVLGFIGGMMAETLLRGIGPYELISSLTKNEENTKTSNKKRKPKKES